MKTLLSHLCLSYTFTFLIFFVFILAAFSTLSEGKIPADEPAILPPLPIIPKIEKRKPFFGTPQPKRLDFRDRDWDRERDRDFELMPPPGSQKREFTTPMDVDQPIDPNEPTYCVCHQVLLSLTLLLFQNQVLLGIFDIFFSYISKVLYHYWILHYDHLGVIWRYDCLW